MIKILYKQVYSIKNDLKDWVLVLYNISANHYVGVPLNKEKVASTDIYIKSIKRYANVSNISDYNRNNVLAPIYFNGLPVKVNDKEFDKIIIASFNEIINYLSELNVSVDNLSYLKWCKDKYELNKKNKKEQLKQNGIYWVNFGINVGSEIRKLRPAILWRSTSDKKVWTVIPLTTKKKNDDYYFHYDLDCIPEGTAKIEDLRNISYKRIVAPFFYNNLLVIISKTDYKRIIQIIKQYYTFDN